jgi:hypothetical protein
MAQALAKKKRKTIDLVAGTRLQMRLAQALAKKKRRISLKAGTR